MDSGIELHCGFMVIARIACTGFAKVGAEGGCRDGGCEGQRAQAALWPQTSLLGLMFRRLPVFVSPVAFTHDADFLSAHFQGRGIFSCLEKLCCSTQETNLLDRVTVRLVQSAVVAIPVRL